MELYISSITNLADARFFGAYGIQYFGFCFDVLDPNAVTIDKAKEIISWLHEPKIIGQFGKHQSWEEMQFVDAQLSLHAIHISADHPELNKIANPKWIKTEDNIIIEITSEKFISGEWTKELLTEALSQHPYGIHISCSHGEKIEYYMELMAILEQHLS